MTDITAMRVSQYVQNLLPFTTFNNVHELNAELVTHVATNVYPDEKFLMDSILRFKSNSSANDVSTGATAMMRALAYIEAQIDMVKDGLGEGEVDVIYLPMTDTTFMFSKVEEGDFASTYSEIKGRFGWVAINSVRHIPVAIQSLVSLFGDKAVGQVERLMEAALHNQTDWYSIPQTEEGIDADILADGYQHAVVLMNQYRELLGRNPDYHATFRQVGGDIHVFLRRKVA